MTDAELEGLLAEIVVPQRNRITPTGRKPGI